MKHSGKGLNEGQESILLEQYGGAWQEKVK